MKIGFIGAGKVGFTMGKHLADHGYNVTGYYNRNLEAASDAALFTGTRKFDSLEEITDASDVLFLTVSDGAIADVWEQLRTLDLTDKIICHTSGALSSDIFEGIDEKGAFGYSIHPLFAVYSRLESYKEFSRSFITIEGNEKYLDYFVDMYRSMGHKVAVIAAENKMRYHAAAVFSSNFIVGVAAIAENMLKSCGFSDEDAGNALAPILMNNCRNIVNAGTVNALTGPVERNDMGTISDHLKVLDEFEKRVYIDLSEAALHVAQVKNPERDYDNLKALLNEKGKERK